MTYSSTILRSATLLLAVLGGWNTTVLATDNPPGLVLYTGSATVLSANVKLLKTSTAIVLADTGEIDLQGNTRDATVLTFDSPAPLRVSATAANAISGGASNVSASTAAVANLDIMLGTVRVTADAVESNSFAVCDSNSSTVATSGESTILNLRINGRLIPVSTKPNTKIVIPLVATIFINEQTNPDVNSIVINAVRVTVPGLLGLVGSEVTISRVASGIFTCSAA